MPLIPKNVYVNKLDDKVNKYKNTYQTQYKIKHIYWFWYRKHQKRF